MIIGSACGRVECMLTLSVKRRRAMLASNPSRNSRPELIADDGQSTFLSGVFYTLAAA